MKKLLIITLLIGATIIKASHTPKDNEPKKGAEQQYSQSGVSEPQIKWKVRGGMRIATVDEHPYWIQPQPDEKTRREISANVRRLLADIKSDQEKR